MRSSLDLPQTGQAGGNEESFEVMRLVQLQLVIDGGSRTDERHVASENVDELRQLVEARPAQPASDARDGVRALELVEVVLSRERRRAHDLLQVLPVRRRVRAVTHRPELEESELAHIHAEPGLPEEDASGRVTPDEDRDQKHQRGAKREQDEGADEVERTLQEAGRARHPRRSQAE